MAEVCLEPSEIIEVDEGDILNGVCLLFIAGSVSDSIPDAHVADARNRRQRLLEGVDESAPLDCRQIRSRLQQHEMADHALVQSRSGSSFRFLRGGRSNRGLDGVSRGVNGLR